MNQFLLTGLIGVIILGIPAESFAKDKWLVPWKYRQKITIKNPNKGKIKQHQLKIEVPFQEGMRRKMQDIRFCKANGITPLPFFVESIIPEEKAVVWVRLKKLSKKNHIYLYFGNRKGDLLSDFSGVFQKLSVTKDTIGLWHCDEGKGDIIKDSSKNQLDLKMVGEKISWGDKDGGHWGNNTEFHFKKGSYIIMPGDGQNRDPHLLLPNSEKLPKLEDFTWEIWVRLDQDLAPGKSPTIIRKGSGLVYLNILSTNQPRTSTWLNKCGMVNSLTSSFRNGMPPITVERWHHLALTFDKDSMQLKLYQDGQEVASQTLENIPPPNKSQLVFGGKYNWTLPGAIDEIRLLSRALKPEEVKANYNRCSSPLRKSFKIKFSKVEKPHND